jgi:hypothetical protein
VDTAALAGDLGDLCKRLGNKFNPETASADALYIRMRQLRFLQGRSQHTVGGNSKISFGRSDASGNQCAVLHDNGLGHCGTNI